MAPAVPAGGVGVVASGTATITPAFPPVTGGLLVDDLLVGIGETGLGQTFPTAASNGFAHVTGSPVHQATNTSLHVLWCRFTAGLTAHAWGDSGDHNVGAYLCVRGVKPTGNPWSNVPVVTTDAAASATATWPAASPTALDCLILFLIATGRDIASTANMGALTGGTGLGAFTEHLDTWVIAGGGGGIGAASAVKAAAGSTGSPTATMGSTDTKSLMTLALESAPAATLPRRPNIYSHARDWDLY